VQAVGEQLTKGSTYYFLNEPAIELAQLLVDAVPCGERVHFTGSGTEATFFALRIARALTGRQKILKFEGGWHGMHDYALWGTVPEGPSEYPHAQADSAGIPASIGELALVAPFNDTARALQIIEDNHADLAAVIVEPLQRVLLPEPGFLQAIREACTRHGIVYIFDEVVTGFRIAWGGAQERYGCVPDMATYGKAMSGGFPMAAIIGKASVMAPLDARIRPRNQLSWASGTLNGNPISASAGVAALKVLRDPQQYAHIHRIGSRLRQGIEDAGAKYGFAAQCPGEDAVFGVRFTSRKPLRNWQDLLTADKAIGFQWAIELLQRGILVNPNEKFYLSITHTMADIDHTLEMVDEAFEAISNH
jgi:glutamate-1-semialdehyde 2,1-aminomutase